MGPHGGGGGGGKGGVCPLAGRWCVAKRGREGGGNRRARVGLARSGFGGGWRGRGGGGGGGEGAVCVFVSKEGGGGGGRRTKVAEGRRKSVCASSAGEGGIEVGEG